MNKDLRISIEIDEILRSKWIQFDKFYAQEFGEEGIPEEPYVFDFFKEYKWEDGVEQIQIMKDDIPEDMSPTEYQVDEDGKSVADPFLFKTESKEYTAKEQYEKFMYEDFLFEIFGSAPQLYRGLDLHINEFISKFKDLQITIVSKENLQTIPPTLFFLGKSMMRFKNYKFYDKFEDYWDDCDILITTNPELLVNIPEGKTVIKIKRPYNKEIKSDYEYINLYDLIKDEKFNKLIE